MSSPGLFITGAAAGNGRETATLLLSEGWLVGAFDVDQKGLATLREEVRPYHRHARCA